MLGTNMLGELYNVRITRGHNISVYMYDDNAKMSTEITLRLDAVNLQCYCKDYHFIV